MFELTIGGQVYNFNFGLGFLREINKTVQAPVDGVPNKKRDMGLRYKLAGLVDGDIEDLIVILDLANKGQTMRLTKAALEAHIEDEDTDIDALFDNVLDFLGKANCTRKTTLRLLEDAERLKSEQN